MRMPSRYETEFPILILILELGREHTHIRTTEKKSFSDINV